MIKGLFLPVTLNLKMVSYELKAVSAPPPPLPPKNKNKTNCHRWVTKHYFPELA